MWYVYFLTALLTSAITASKINTPFPAEHHEAYASGGTEFKLKPYASDPKSGECELELCEKCISKFRHVVYYSEAAFVYLKLLPSDGVGIRGENSVVGENIWIWTFYGKDGGLQFLRWPMEFGIWSMGLLTSYVIKDPMHMVLKSKSGNCSNLKVGSIKDDYTISTALLNLTLTINKVTGTDDKYGASFFCYNKRMYITSEFIYVLCKHIVCPLEALQYHCCNYYYNTTYGYRTIGCRKEEFRYDPVSWILPTFVSVLLFLVCPLLLLNIANNFDMKDNQSKMQHSMDVTGNYENRERDIKISKNEFIFLNDTYHTTLSGTIFQPIRNCCRCMLSKNPSICQSIIKRLIRSFWPFLSLSFIAIQIALDYFYLYTFVLTSIQKGVPLGFRSMLAGYEDSRESFLPYLGGPYCALGVYLLITFMMLGVPTSVSRLLSTGLPTADPSEDLSPLRLKLSSIESYGSLRIRRKRGFDKIYCFLLSQFYLLINSKFWIHALTVQYRRWVRFYNFSRYFLLLFPVYFCFCLVEIVLCLVCYGCPIISFGFIIIKAYCGLLWNQKERRSCLPRVFFALSALISVASIIFFFFILCTIFMDACVFITRVVTFTFTGIVVYPKVSYGYIIFTFTVIYYIMQSLHDFSSKYQTLLKETISVCEQRQRANDVNKLVAKMDGFKGVSIILFERVIEEHCPKRKQVFLSFVKVCLILTLLGISINVLIETDGFRELHVVMHVGTALFICALPQIVKSTCMNLTEKYRRKRFRKELDKTVRHYYGYLNTGETSDSELVEVE